MPLNAIYCELVILKRGFALKIDNAAKWMVVVAIAAGGVYATNLLILLWAAWPVWWISKHFFNDDKQLIIPALSVNAAHALLFILSGVLAGSFIVIALDLLVYAIGLLWLIKKPSGGPLYFLGIYQIALLIANGIVFIDTPTWNVAHKILLAHLIWRALALFLLVNLFFKIREKPFQNA